MIWRILGKSISRGFGVLSRGFGVLSRGFGVLSRGFWIFVVVFEDKSRFWVFKSRFWKSKQFLQKNIGGKTFPQNNFLDFLERGLLQDL